MLNIIKNNKLFFQIMKFIIVGGIATIIDYIIFYILYEKFGINTVISNILSFTISTIYNFIASVKWVFDIDKKKGVSRQFIIFITFSIIGLALNTGIVYLCVDIIKIYSLIGKIVATIIVMVFNFITRKLFLE